MKKLLLAILLFACQFGGKLVAQPPFEEDIVVGKQPAMILEDASSGKFHIFCLGYDKNFDGNFDIEEGDVKPSWWSYNIIVPLKSEIPMLLADKVRDFDYSVGNYIARPAHNKKQIFFQQNGSIIAYDLADGSLIDTVAENIDPIAMSFFNEKLFISIRNQVEKDVVLVFDIKSKSYLDTIPAYNNVQMTLPIEYNGNRYLIILNEGNFGTNDSKLQFIDLSNGNEELAVVDIGGGGNFIDYAIRNDDVWIAATMNSSHQIQIVSLKKMEIIKTINLQTEGFNGPREAHFNNENDLIYVSAYDGNIYEVNPETGDAKNYLECKAKPEGFYAGLAGNDYLLVANIMDKLTYAPDSTVSVYVRYSSIEDVVNNTNLHIYPNPAQDLIHIQIPENISIEIQAKIEIYTSTGLLVKKKMLSLNQNKEFIIKNSDFPRGDYFIKVTSGKNVYFGAFNVSN